MKIKVLAICVLFVMLLFSSCGGKENTASVDSSGNEINNTVPPTCITYLIFPSFEEMNDALYSPLCFENFCFNVPRDADDLLDWYAFYKDFVKNGVYVPTFNGEMCHLDNENGSSIFLTDNEKTGYIDLSDTSGICRFSVSFINEDNHHIGFSYCSLSEEVFKDGWMNAKYYASDFKVGTITTADGPTEAYLSENKKVLIMPYNDILVTMSVGSFTSDEEFIFDDEFLKKLSFEKISFPGYRDEVVSSIDVSSYWRNEAEYKYTSMDEFVLDAKEKGVEVFCKCKEYEGQQNMHAVYPLEIRHENTQEFFDNAVYEVYYGGEKAELYEPIGFNVYFDSGKYNAFRGNSRCEYFAKLNYDERSNYFAFFTFYTEFDWDSIPKDYCSVKVKLDGKETECFVVGEVDAETGKLVKYDGDNDAIYLKLGDGAVVINFEMREQIENYIEKVDLEGYSPEEKGHKFWDDLYTTRIRLNDVEGFENFLNLLEFKKVDVSTVQ